MVKVDAFMMSEKYEIVLTSFDVDLKTLKEKIFEMSKLNPENQRIVFRHTEWKDTDHKTLRQVMDAWIQKLLERNNALEQELVILNKLKFTNSGIYSIRKAQLDNEVRIGNIERQIRSNKEEARALVNPSVISVSVVFKIANPLYKQMVKSH